MANAGPFRKYNPIFKQIIYPPHCLSAYKAQITHYPFKTDLGGANHDDKNSPA
jgi:hypothetical protein